MKSFILCLILLLTAIYHRGHGASVRGNEIMNSADEIVQPEWEESNVLEPLLRTKRQSHLSICRFCCGCCKNKGCGYCCRT